MTLRLPIVSASLFSIVLGLTGLGTAWRLAARVWGLPAGVGEALMWVAMVIWGTLLILYAAKLMWARELALREAMHPIQCCFVGLIGVSTMLIAAATLPYSRLSALLLFAVGATGTIGFAAWRTGALWKGGRAESSTTAVLYLPAVGGSFVAASLLAVLGWKSWGQMVFGAGLFSWLAIESVLIHRLYHAEPLPPSLRPSLGIQLAPPSVGLVALLNVTDGSPGIASYALLGYALFQATLLLRLIPWIGEQSFVPAYWGFTFGLSAIATAPLMMMMRGELGPAQTLAPYLFLASNGLIGAIALLTLRKLFLDKSRSPISERS